MPTPDGALMLNGLGFLLLSTGVCCGRGGLRLADGLQAGGDHRADRAGSSSQARCSRTSARSAASAQGVLSQAIVHFSPVSLGDGGRHASTMAARPRAVVIVALARGVPRARRVAHAHDGRLADLAPPSAQRWRAARPCGARAPRSRRPGARSPGKGPVPRRASAGRSRRRRVAVPPRRPGRCASRSRGAACARSRSR